MVPMRFRRWTPRGDGNCITESEPRERCVEHAESRGGVSTAFLRVWDGFASAGCRWRSRGERSPSIPSGQASPSFRWRVTALRRVRGPTALHSGLAQRSARCPAQVSVRLRSGQVSRTAVSCRNDKPSLTRRAEAGGRRSFGRISIRPCTASSSASGPQSFGRTRCVPTSGCADNPSRA